MQHINAIGYSLYAPLTLAQDFSLAFAVRADAPKLLSQLNAHLAYHHMEQPYVSSQDIRMIRKLGQIRVLTYESPTTFFQRDGQFLGFDYSLSKKFAESLGIQLTMIAVPRDEDIFAWLTSGRGDLVALGGLYHTTSHSDLLTSIPLYQTHGILISRKNMDSHRINPEAKTIWLTKNSPYAEKAVSFAAQYGISIQNTSYDNADVLITQIANGLIDYAIVDAHRYNVAKYYYKNLKLVETVSPAASVGWFVRRSNPQLLSMVNDFLYQSKGGLFYNLTYSVYFQNKSLAHRNVRDWHLDGSQLSPYDPLVQNYAKKYRFDWRLVAAQIYQESQFNPYALSHAGAQGLMQLLPNTAKQMGFEQLHHPEANIHAGVKYLAWIRKQFASELPVHEQIWFSLAAYNAGYGHVEDARILAKKLNLDPNQWFGHVEYAITLLAHPYYYRDAKYGRCNGYEPVQYVKKIRNRYLNYVQLTT